MEFADKDSVVTAMALDESLFRGRQIKVWHWPSLENDTKTVYAAQNDLRCFGANMAVSLN